MYAIILDKVMYYTYTLFSNVAYARTLQTTLSYVHSN